MKIEKIFEDSNILVVNKPSGIIVHRDGRNEEYSLADWVLEKYPEAKNVGESFYSQKGEEILRPGIVHRLDRDTSGVILVAKNNEAFSFLKKQFQERLIEKTYNCFVYGTPSPKEGSIDAPIGRSAKDFRKKSSLPNAKGEKREAFTDYKTLKTSRDFSFLEVVPKTGRTHQIRVHLKSIGCPIIHDPLYFSKTEKKYFAKNNQYPLGFSRLALHARSISFLTLDEEKVKIETELPEDFKKALESLG